MNFRAIFKQWIPSGFHPLIRTCLRMTRRIWNSNYAYHDRVQSEIGTYSGIEELDTLPPIAHYWSNKYLFRMLEPFGFTNSIEMFRVHIARQCRQVPNETLAFMSIGCGNAEPESCIVKWLTEQDITNFVFEALDLNPEQLRRARATAEAKRISQHFIFSNVDVNKWKPKRRYHGILAIQCLHHFVELERLFEKVAEALHPDGYFMTDDMIGRNGHQRWPEALPFVKRLWAELPEKYKYNHCYNRVDKEYVDTDYSTHGFEGIRSQDVLPLLVKRFNFEFFVAWGNILDIFIDRCYGPNFDPENEEERAFIDRVHAIDVEEIESGRLKPTHMYAVMTKIPVAHPRFYKHLSPEFCVRWPDGPQSRESGYSRMTGWTSSDSNGRSDSFSKSTS